MRNSERKGGWRNGIYDLERGRGGDLVNCFRSCVVYLVEAGFVDCWVLSKDEKGQCGIGGLERKGVLRNARRKWTSLKTVAISLDV